MALGDPYVTAEELKTDFNIADFDDETVIEAAVNAASSWVNAHCGRQFNAAASATARVFYPRNRTFVEVDDISTTSGLVIKTDPNDDGTFETTWTSSDYQLEPLNGVHNGETGWPYREIRAVASEWFPIGNDRASVEVTATWGWAAVPSPVKRATAIMAAKIYKRRDSAEGVLAGFGDFGPVRVGSRIDPDVEALLHDYVLDKIPVE